MAPDAGKKSKKILEKILKYVPFLIVKSIKTDIYRRYVADIFLALNPKEPDPQKVVYSGLYLNQFLLNRDVVEIF